MRQINLCRIRSTRNSRNGVTSIRWLEFRHKGAEVANGELPTAS